jgi:hypothetical protein
MGLGRIEILLRQISVSSFGLLRNLTESATEAEQLAPHAALAPVHATLCGDAPFGHHPIERELRRLQAEIFAARGHRSRCGVEMQRERRQRLLRFGDGVGEARPAFEQALRQPVAQPNKRDWAQMYAGILGARRRIEEVIPRLE